jgi:glyoxylase-like metal-dependent hydrolase (beta-lactamase superfamily II)
MSWRWRRFIFKPDSFGVVDWTSGDSSVRPRTISEAERQALMHRVPHLLVLDAATRAKGLRDLGVRKRNGVSYDVVEAVMADDSHLTLWFTRKPVTLARVEYSLYMAGLGDAVVGWQWHGWKRDEVLKLAPSGHAINVNGTPFQQVEYTHYQTGSAESDRLLSIPADLGPASRTKQEAPPPAAGPATGEVAPGLHIASIRGFQVMFVEFKDFVLLFDAPASAVGLESIPASDQDVTDLVSVDAAALVARTCPAKPIRYVAISHHHSDHLGGVQVLAKDGVTFLAAPGHVDAVHKALDAAQTLNSRHPGASGSQAKASVAAVSDRKTITDGTRTVEVINVGRNPHTDENLFLWMPQEKLLLQGDLFYYREGDRFPPPGRETMNGFFAKWLAAHGIQPKAVYGVHGAGAASPEALARALRPSVSSTR